MPQDITLAENILHMNVLLLASSPQVAFWAGVIYMNTFIFLLSMWFVIVEMFILEVFMRDREWGSFVLRILYDMQETRNSSRTSLLSPWSDWTPMIHAMAATWTSPRKVLFCLTFTYCSKEMRFPVDYVHWYLHNSYLSVVLLKMKGVYFTHCL